jgi:hypothetical protein
MLLLLTGAVSMNAQDVQMGHSTVAVVTGTVVNVGKMTSTGAIDLRQNAEGAGLIINEESGKIYTNGLIVGAETSVDNKGYLCVDCGTTPSYPEGTIVIPNAKTGFISGAYTSLPTTAKSGNLLLAAADGPTATQKTWTAISGYNSTSYVNNTASKFVGTNAGCADGWRLPSIVELKAIADYLNTTYGSWTGTGGPAGFTPLRANYYWSSTYYEPSDASYGLAWLVGFSNGTTNFNSYTYNPNSVRCVHDL